MKKRTMSLMFFLAVFVFSEIGLTQFAVVAGTNLTPQGIEFPDASKQSTAARRWYTSILVSPRGTATASGTALLNALNSITDASSSKPYLITLEPGIYDIEEQYLLMKSYVDIEGSGEGVTVITGDHIYKYHGVVEGKDYAELRFLTVKNTGGGYYATAVYNYNDSPSLLHVTVDASGGTENRGVCNRESSSPTMTHVNILAHGGTKSYGVDNDKSSPRMNNVTVEAFMGGTNYGVYNQSSASPRMNYVTVEASGGTANYGVYNQSASPRMNHVMIEGGGDSTHGGYGVSANSYSTVWINHSVIDGYSNSIECTDSTTYVGNTQLKGGSVFDYNGTSVKCAGIFDEGYHFYPSTCP